MAGNTCDTLNVGKALSRNVAPFHDGRSGQTEPVSDSSEHSATLPNEIHAIHTQSLTTSKRTGQAELLTHGMRHDQHNPAMEISDRIRLARTRAGLSQTQLARTVGVTRGMVGQWETGKPPGRDKLVAIAGATGVTVPYLLGQEPDPAGLGPRMDTDTITLLKLWHQLSPRQKRSHLELFRSSVALRKEMEAEARSKAPVDQVEEPERTS